MKKMFVLIAAPVLLSTLGMAQTPTPTAPTTTTASIIGCLSGSGGAYSVAQDSSTKTFKITSSSVDLKPHIGHQVELTGQKSSAAVFGSPETVSVTAVSMISEHCAMAAASNPAPVDPATATVAAPAATPVPATTAAASAPVATTPAATTTTTTTAAAPAVVAATTPVAAAKPAEPAATPVMASETKPLPNTAPASLKAVKVTGKIGDDGKTFVNDKDSKSWTVANPDAVKGHEGHHVTLTAHLDTTKSEVEIVSLKMAK